MVAGHLTTKNGYWYLILQIRDEHGQPKSKWIATHMKVNGNKRKAEAMLLEARRQYTSLSDMRKRTRDTLLSDYLMAWVSTCKPKVAVSTYAGYKNCIDQQIAPYFDQKRIKLIDLNAFCDPLPQIAADVKQKCFQYINQLLCAIPNA